MKVVAFDNTMLSILLNPMGKIPNASGTNIPVELAKDRAESVIESIQKSRGKIVIPAPACAELLTVIGPSAEQYVKLIGRSKIFEIGSFDARSAIELAILNREIFAPQDQKDKLDSYQKRKVDRQIIAICKVYGVVELYTDDKGLGKRAALCGISPIGIEDIPIPEKFRQGSLKLEQHDDMFDSDDERDDVDQ